MTHDIDINAVALATHKSMCEPPEFVRVAIELEGTPDRAARAAILASVDEATGRRATHYVQSPKATRGRERRLQWMRTDPRRVEALKVYYASHIVDFITEHGATYDPRLLNKNGSAIVPFDLFPRQRDAIEFMLERYQRGEQGVIAKARDSGMSWCAMSMLASLCIFIPNFAAIIGSNLENKIDQSGTTGTLLHKARMFLNYVPVEFRGGWNEDKYSAHLRLWWPNGSALYGQAGTAIGRGERAAIVVLDEAAHLEHAEKIEESLAATSECKIWISTPYGPDNSFAQKAFNSAIPRLDYSWMDDPRKVADPTWKDRKIAADGPQKFAREYGVDFHAGTEGQLIKREHLEACIDAHVKLGIEPNGKLFGGFDIGNGGDPSAFCVTRGFLIEHVETWPSSTNALKELRKAFEIADRYGITDFAADAVGVGAAIEGDAQVLNEQRRAQGRKPIRVRSFKGSEAAVFPEKPSLPGSEIKAKDRYMNKKAQSYNWIAYRAAQTAKLVSGEPIKNRDDILAINSKIPMLAKLLAELGQITGEETPSGRMKVDKYNEGFSPNAADSVACATCPRNDGLMIPEGTADRLGGGMHSPQPITSVNSGFGPPPSMFLPSGRVL